MARFPLFGDRPPHDEGMPAPRARPNLDEEASACSVQSKVVRGNGRCIDVEALRFDGRLDPLPPIWIVKAHVKPGSDRRRDVPREIDR